RQVMFFLEEELQELERLVRILRLREYRPVLAVERGDADLAGRTVRPQQRHERLRAPEILRRVLLDVADRAGPAEPGHRDRPCGQRGQRVEVLLARPATRLELVQLLDVLERLEHGFAVELRPPLV